ncbi:MAG: hypothetical protein HKN47_25195 [Pirellulaceae bacterium]|nr:hypothetical protein [Pirellulaceae bacterium]
MNTPTHIVISIAALSRSPRDDRETQPTTYFLPAVMGAVLPDAAMYVFYGVEKFIVGSSERVIWSTQYYLPAWQNVFDWFNSVPVCLIALLAALRWGKRAWAVLFASMLLHIVCDFPLHHDDGHRHFWPLSDWRFESPVSYWDPHHYGIYAAAAEMVLFAICYAIAMRRHRRILYRVLLSAMAVMYALMMIGYFAYVLSRET